MPEREDIYQSPYQKAALGNDSGANVFISIHRSFQPLSEPIYSGGESLVYNAWLLRDHLQPTQTASLRQVGFKSLGVNERPNLVVLRQSNIPAVLVEVGFINNEKGQRAF